MTKAVEVLRHEIVDVLGCGIEVGKAAIVASSAQLAAELKRKFGPLAGPDREPTRAAANLGIDYAPGRPRTTHAASGRRRRRMDRLARKAARMARIRAVAGKRAKQIFVAGPMAEAVYGAAVNGLSGAEVQSLRRAAATALTPRARGRSLSAVLLFAGAPTWKGEVETILQYSRMTWMATLLGATAPRSGELTLAQLASIWREVDSGGRVPQPGPRAWSQVRGPISAMRLTLSRVGWAMSGPFTLVDNFGEEVLLTKVPPALLAQLLRRAVLHTLEAKVGATWAADDPQFVGRRVAADHVIAQLSTDRKLTAADRAAYRSVACGAIMTYSRAARSGYLVRDLCPLCKRASDTVRHRVWHCTHPDAVAAREAVAPQWLRREAERRQACDSFWIHGLIPHPAEEWPRPASAPVAVCSYGNGGQGSPTDDDGTATRPRLCGVLAGDGSCSTHVFPELRRAGTAIVQRRGDGTRGWTLQCPIPPPLPQTPQAAEFAVLALAVQFQHPTARTTIASDCANVVESYNGPASRAVGPKRAYAGVMREALGDVSWQRRTTVRKVKAHVDPSSVADPADRIDAEENGAADVAAKEAALLHPQPTPAQVADLSSSLRRSRLIVRTVARVIQVFPPMPLERMQRAPAPREGATVHIDGAHDWVFVSGMWRCRVCMRMTVKPEITPALACQRCEGPRASLAAEAIVGRGHILAKTQGPAQVLFCVQCGAYSARRAYGLGAQCAGVPRPAGRQALARIRRGLQPWETRDGANRHRGLLGMAMAWDASRRDYVECGPAQPSSRRRTRTQARLHDSGAPDDGHARAAAAAVGAPDPHQPLITSPTEPAAKMARTSASESARSPVAAADAVVLPSSLVEGRMNVDTATGSDEDSARVHLGGDSPCIEPAAASTSSGTTPGVAGDGTGHTDGPDGGGVAGSTRRAHRGLRPHRDDVPPERRGSHRPDPRPRLEGSISPRARPRHRVDGTAVDAGSISPRGHRGGAPAAGCASPRALGESCEDDGRFSVSSNVGPNCNRRRSSLAGTNGGPGGSNDLALRPGVRAQPVGPPSPPAPTVAARGHRGAPQGLTAERPAAAHDSSQDRDDVNRWALPWLWNPPWLYLPHAGAGDGSDLVDAMSSAKRRRLTDVSAGRADPPAIGDCSLGNQPGHALDGPHPAAARAAIRGREERDSAPGPQSLYPIRGLGDQLGPDGASSGAAAATTRADPARARAQAKVDARLSTMAASIQLHADRVAAKRARTGLEHAAPCAADRIEALRRRVASRAATADSVTAAAHASCDDASAHAAARAAHHAVPAVPVGELRQLSN